MSRFYLLAGTAVLVMSGVVQAAVFTTVANYNFSGSIGGGNYTEVGGTPGSAPVTSDSGAGGTGLPTLSGGQIFFTNNSTIDETLIPTITTVAVSSSIVMEALITPTGTQGTGNVGNIANIFSLEATSGTNLVLRFDGTGTGTGFLRGYLYSGGNFDTVSSTDGQVATGVQSHLAMVYTAGSSLKLYLNGLLISSDTSLFSHSGNFTTKLGLFNDNGTAASKDRGFNGSSNAISVRTFTGTFDSTTDFVLLPLPEPGSAAALFAVAILVGRRRRQVR